MKIALKIYWFIMLLKFFGGIWFIGFNLYNEILELTPYIYILLILDFVAVTGLYGYVWKVAYINQQIWLPFTVSYILLSILNAVGLISVIKMQTNIDYLGILTLWIYLPQFIALALYSNKKFPVWNKQTT